MGKVYRFISLRDAARAGKGLSCPFDFFFLDSMQFVSTTWSIKKNDVSIEFLFSPLSPVLRGFILFSVHTCTYKEAFCGVPLWIKEGNLALTIYGGGTV